MIGCKLSTGVVWTGAACQDRSEGRTGKFLSCEGPQVSSNFSVFLNLILCTGGSDGSQQRIVKT